MACWIILAGIVIVHRTGTVLGKARFEAVLIAGPTASGKTGLAVKIASMCGGLVINADSMQVYDAIPGLTAQPTADEQAGVPHRLFGFLPPDEACSVARWLEAAGKELETAREAGLLPVFAGGTGLYFKALLEGISPVPEIDPAIRERMRALAAADPGELMAQLREKDPGAAAAIGPSDRQRAVRALEVLESTGRTLSWWQARDRGKALIDGESALKLLVLPPRDIAPARIKARLLAMVEAGALEEVGNLLSTVDDPELPVMRAIGVRELAGVVRGEYSQEKGIELAAAATRQFAKRQRTWFRNQLSADWLTFASIEEALAGDAVRELCSSRASPPDTPQFA